MLDKNIFEADETPPYQQGGNSDGAVQALLVNIDGYEGPIDVLLTLARDQKVDLRHVSVLQLAEQYLRFIEGAKNLKIELAADYLVMASWLAYLKSRLLLPSDENEDEPSGAEMAAALAYQLERLEAMRGVLAQLLKLPQLGQSRFARGMPDGLHVSHKTDYKASLYDLLSAYGDIERRKTFSEYTPKTFDLMSIDQARERLEKMFMGQKKKTWHTLFQYMPKTKNNTLYTRSSLASLLTASLEMTKQGRVEVKQEGAFMPIYLREAEG